MGKLAVAVSVSWREGLPISFWISKPLTTLPTKLVTLLTLEDAAAGWALVGACVVMNLKIEQFDWRQAFERGP